MSGDDNDDSSDGIAKSSSDEEDTTGLYRSLLDKASKREAAINGAHQASSLSDHSASEKDADEFSDISDNSDLFHVEVDQSKSWCTPEDEDLITIRELKQHLREYSLLPADAPDANRSFTDVHSGMRLPTTHCAFRGCRYCKDYTSRSQWDQERDLYIHLKQHHEMKTVFDKFSGDRHDKELTALAFYVAAICEVEREHMPLLGPSIDRRLFTMVCRLSGNSNVRSCGCFCCAQSWTSVDLWKKHFYQRS